MFPYTRAKHIAKQIAYHHTTLLALSCFTGFVLGAAATVTHDFMLVASLAVSVACSCRAAPFVWLYEYAPHKSAMALFAALYLQY